MNWNLQTFFDASLDGTEYKEFRNSQSSWSIEKYKSRLKRLSSVIKLLDADVVILQELEKESQLIDISNELSGTFDFSKLYKYGVFSSSTNSSIGCAILSRYPVKDISCHNIEVKTGKEQPSLRPIIRASVLKNGKSITLFVNHWKSKSSGSESSEIWRKTQENLLADLMAKYISNGNAVIAAGDFNKDIFDFKLDSGKQNVILCGKKNLDVFSPWLSETYKSLETGSYWYKNEWERIDHFFTAGNAEIIDFCAENSGEWADSEGHPIRYQVWNGKGYSDHLPITCTVKF